MWEKEGPKKDQQINKTEKVHSTLPEKGKSSALLHNASSNSTFIFLNLLIILKPTNGTLTKSQYLFCFSELRVGIVGA